MRFLKNKVRLLSFVPILIISTVICSCEKMLEVRSPSDSVSGLTVFRSSSDATSAITGIYQRMIAFGRGFTGGASGISANFGLMADEIKPFVGNTGISQLYIDDFLPGSSVVSSSWTDNYSLIYQCNAAYEGLSKSNELTVALKNQLLGEVLFLRSFFYFYLVNQYGDIPLILTTDYEQNRNLGRTSISGVYQQIETDLVYAIDLLSENYSSSSGTFTDERLRPNKAVVKALLARVTLYQNKWNEAIKYSSSVIGNTSMYSLLEDCNSVFLKNSREAILQFYPLSPSGRTEDGYCFILNSNFNSNSPFALTTNLVSQFSPNDHRFTNWIGSYNGYNFPRKYQDKGNFGTSSPSEYIMVLRLAEQYLIRAEAYARTGQFALAATDLNVIRKRAGLPNYSGPMDEDNLVQAIIDERQKELFTEWGHRWFDLKRTGKLDAVMSVVTPQKGGTWASYKQLLPIPVTPLAPNVTQNPGYPN